MFREASLHTPQRSTWLSKIQEVGVRRRAEFYYQQLDPLRSLRREVRHDLLAESGKHNVAKLLRQIPSIGPIRAALLIALSQTPYRFRTNRQQGCGVLPPADDSRHRSTGGDGRGRRRRKRSCLPQGTRVCGLARTGATTMVDPGANRSCWVSAKLRHGVANYTLVLGVLAQCFASNVPFFRISRLSFTAAFPPIITSDAIWSEMV